MFKSGSIIDVNILHRNTVRVRNIAHVVLC